VLRVPRIGTMSSPWCALARRRETDIDPLRIALAWRERDGSPLVAAFAAVVRELAGGAPARPPPGG
jgi:hypothetical protein